MKLLRVSLAAVAFASLVGGCPLNAPPPRQREDWSLPPMQYGDTRFEGLRAPRKAQVPEYEDAGAP